MMQSNAQRVSRTLHVVWLMFMALLVIVVAIGVSKGLG